MQEVGDARKHQPYFPGHAKRGQRKSVYKQVKEFSLLVLLIAGGGLAQGRQHADNVLIVMSIEEYAGQLVPGTHAMMRGLRGQILAEEFHCALNVA